MDWLERKQRLAELERELRTLTRAEVWGLLALVRYMRLVSQLEGERKQVPSVWDDEGLPVD
jgi:hypothetical protein